MRDGEYRVVAARRCLPLGRRPGRGAAPFPGAPGMGQVAQLLARRPDARLDRRRADDPPLGRRHGRRGRPALRPSFGDPHLVDLAGGRDDLHRPARTARSGTGTRPRVASWASSPGSTIAADSMAVSPDGKSLLVGGRLGGRFALWSVAERRRDPQLSRASSRETPCIISRSRRMARRSPPSGGSGTSPRARCWPRSATRDEQNDWRRELLPHLLFARRQAVITARVGGVRIWDIAAGQGVAVGRPGRDISCHVASPSLPTAVFSRPAGSSAAPRERRRSDRSTSGSWPRAGWSRRWTVTRRPRAGCAFSPDGRWLASCSGDRRSGNDRTVRIWDVATGRELRRFEGHRGTVNAVAFTPDGRSVVSGSEDATALVWDVSDLTDRRPVPTLRIPFDRPVAVP